MNQELARLQAEVSSKLERNLELHQQIDDVRNADSDTTDEDRIAQANRHHALGLQLFREKRYERALTELTSALALNPGNPTIVNNYGFLLHRMERYDEAVTWLQKTLTLEPDRAVAHVNLADSLVELGRHEEARDYYRRYLELWPESPRRAEIQRYLEN